LSNEASSKLSEFAIQAAPWLEQNMGIWLPYRLKKSAINILNKSIRLINSGIHYSTPSGWSIRQKSIQGFSSWLKWCKERTRNNIILGNHVTKVASPILTAYCFNKISRCLFSSTAKEHSRVSRCLFSSTAIRFWFIVSLHSAAGTVSRWASY
jgi:hypothetical protein